MQQVKWYLAELQQILQQHQLWQTIPPSAQSLASQQPFAIDTLQANEWLQWIFIPRMQALIDSGAELPATIAISPYIEEALKQHSALPQLLTVLTALEQYLTQEQ